MLIYLNYSEGDGNKSNFSYQDFKRPLLL